MLAGSISQFSTYSGSADTLRRAQPHVASRKEAVRPIAPTARSNADARGRGDSVVIDLRPNPPEETAKFSAKRQPERSTDAKPSNTAAPLGPPSRSAASESPLTRRANADTPYRRRSFEQSYEAVERLDAPVPHRGSIFDLRI